MNNLTKEKYAEGLEEGVNGGVLFLLFSIKNHPT